MKILIYYFITLLSLMILDWLWLGVATKDFYKNHIGNMFRADFVWLAIIIFYILYAGAIVYFVVLPAQGAWAEALLGGFVLGFTVYMTYDLINYATLKNWPLIVVFTDIAWGSVMTGIVATVAILVGKV